MACEIMPKYNWLGTSIPNIYHPPNHPLKKKLNNPIYDPLNNPTNPGLMDSTLTNQDSMELINQLSTLNRLLRTLYTIPLLTLS